MRRRKPMRRRKSIRRKIYKILNFGKYDGQMSLPEAILHDPNWFFCVFEKNMFAFEYNGFDKEARDLNFKARNVKIPLPGWKHWRVKYTFEHCGEVLSGFDLIEISSPEEANPDRLDLWCLTDAPGTAKLETKLCYEISKFTISAASRGD